MREVKVVITRNDAGYQDEPGVGDVVVELSLRRPHGFSTTVPMSAAEAAAAYEQLGDLLKANGIIDPDF